MKPVSDERFFTAVNKAYKQYCSNKTVESVPSSPLHVLPEIPSSSDFIFVKTENRLVKIFFSDILYVQGYGDYIKIYLTGDRVLLSLQSLNRFESVLPDNFVRVHRSYIIALDKISEIENKRIKIKGELIPIGESYTDRFFRKVLPDSRQYI